MRYKQAHKRTQSSHRGNTLWSIFADDVTEQFPFRACVFACGPTRYIDTSCLKANFICITNTCYVSFAQFNYQTNNVCFGSEGLECENYFDAIVSLVCKHWLTNELCIRRLVRAVLESTSTNKTYCNHCVVWVGVCSKYLCTCKSVVNKTRPTKHTTQTNSVPCCFCCCL